MENLLNEIKKVPKDKKLIVFDLDGTLTQSKSDMDEEMAGLLRKLLEKKIVAVIGGGKYETLQKQFLTKLDASPELLKNLFIFPATATVFYKYGPAGWAEVYKQSLSKKEKEKVLAAFEKTFQELDYKHPEITYGELIEDRETQITFSALGQNAPLETKEKWSRENSGIRSKIEEILQKRLPDMEVKVVGLTSIDLTRKGVDKGYGIRQMEKYLGIPIKEMLFVGNDFSHEGNDEPALQSGVLCFEVKSVEATKKLIRYFLND